MAHSDTSLHLIIYIYLFNLVVIFLAHEHKHLKCYVSMFIPQLLCSPIHAQEK